MPMTTLGKTGLRVSRIAAGGWDASLTSVEIGVGVVQRAIELGINFFDSAHTYNEGRSDQVYGKAIDQARRRTVLLMSKRIISRIQASGEPSKILISIL